ncbi:MAG: N-glycosylase/DNA lyase [Desulfurococcales archaeon]|jgi:DNA-(apurinic or apyrimidinic site) lyase|nr:N-glycosylase/DNA lyase [Desulfurococcales archaeon]
MAIRINNYRIETIGGALARLGLEAIYAIEERDPQYRALEYLVNRLGDCSSASLLAVLNALSAYQLSMPGEDYWWEFARYPFKQGDPDKLVEEFISFLSSSRGNVAARDKKISRIKRLVLSQAHIEIYVKIVDLFRDLETLREILARSLGKEGYEKTIVFAVKILYYVARICGSKTSPPDTIELPIDRRIAGITYTSEIADTDARDPVEEIMKNYREAQRAWKKVSEISRISMINLDSLLWLCGKYLRDDNRIEKAYQEIKSYAGRKADERVLREAISELLRRKL